MLKKVWTLTALTVLGTMVFANVDLRTNIHDIFYRGTCEEAGSITMSVNGNDFVSASTSTPVFIRVKLDKVAELCSTLVDCNACPDNNVTCGPFENFIYLAMRVEGQSYFLMNAPAETVSIVRWRAGENQLWLRVQSSSSGWVDNQQAGSIGAPDDNSSVAWTFGVSARSSHQTTLPLYTAVQANLPCNTLCPGDPGDMDWYVSTLICVDVSGSTLLPETTTGNSDQSALKFDTISFDDGAPQYVSQGDCHEMTEEVSCAATAGDIDWVRELPINFSGDNVIARGITQHCELSFRKHGLAYADLCLDPGGQGVDDDCWIPLANDLTLDLNCDYGLNFLTQFLVYTPGFTSYGLRVDTYTNGDPIPSPYFADAYRIDPADLIMDRIDTTTAIEMWEYITDEDYMYVSHGMILASTAWIIYLGEDDQDSRVTFNLHAQVWSWCESDPTEVVLTVGGFASNHGQEYDAAPYDQDWQFYRCPPSYYQLNSVEWTLGAYEPCLSDRVSIFFPYLPMIAENDTFWAGISIVNQGAVNFDADEVEAHIYEADGSRWDAFLPALPVRNQHTFLLTDDEQGVGFYTDTLFIPVEAQGSDLIPLDNRSSMFVVGQHYGSSTVDTFGPDLDGFCMIGNSATGDVYGYLPRNYDNGIPLQAADLPVLRAKTASNVEMLPPKTVYRR
jgi:hypothetical protein